MKMRLTLLALLSLVVFSGAKRVVEPIPRTNLTDNVLFIGAIETKDGVTSVAKPAVMILGSADSANYTAEFEVKPAVKGAALSLSLFCNAPEDPKAGGVARTDFSRDKDGASLNMRRYTWDGAAWAAVGKGAGMLSYLPGANDKTSPNLLKRDNLTPPPVSQRWVKFRIDAKPAAADLWVDGRFIQSVPLPEGTKGAVRMTFAPEDQVRAIAFKRYEATGRFVAVDLTRLASGTGEPTAVISRTTHDGVPFDWLDAGKTRIDLSKARWPEAHTDPSKYNEIYDNGPLFIGDPRQPAICVPADDYSAVHVLAVADDGAETLPGFTLRAGTFDAYKQLLVFDFPAAVPAASATAKLPAGETVDVASGKLVHVRVPLSVSFAQDLGDTLEIEFTKEMRLARRRPDPARFRYRPLGLPSGVKIAAVTLERSPIKVRVSSDEAGNAFNEPNPVEFKFELKNVSSAAQTFSIDAVATHLRGGEVKAQTSGKIAAGETANVKLAIPTTKRGYHDVVFRLNVDGKPLFSRASSFAILPAIARPNRGDSPFGTWDFSGGHFSCNNADTVGSLYQKAGLRFGMFNFAAADRQRWGVQQGTEYKGHTDIERLKAWREKSPDGLKVALLMHENAISGPHISRAPELFSDRPPYKFNEAEQKSFDGLFNGMIEVAKALRAFDPDIELRLGNGALPTKEAFLQRGFPKELFNSLGNESGAFGRPPETQPPDFVSHNAGIWMDHQLLKAYGYGDKAVTQCYEICYPSTNPGNLTPQTQADYFVRHAVHSMAWEIPQIRFGVISDVGSSYRYSNWGASGFCYAYPALNVKPSFVSVATMTWMLDGAKLSRTLDMGSLSLYGVEFNSPGERKTCVMWTLRGERDVELEVTGGEWTLTDDQGEVRKLAVENGRLKITLTTSPLYVVGKGGAVKSVGPAASAPRYTEAPVGKVVELAPLNNLDGWAVDAEQNYTLEYHNFMTPRRQGNFKFEPVERFEEQSGMLRVTPQAIKPTKPTATMPMYAVLRHARGIAIPGKPTELGVWVNGNSGWGRIIFEMKDASGQTWMSIGAPQRGAPSEWLLDAMPKEALGSEKMTNLSDWNTDDVFGDSRINFDGWRYVGVKVPGHYPGEGFPTPPASQWRYDKDGVVHYPLTLTAVVVELPEKVLHLMDYVPASRPEIYIRRIVAAQDDSPTVKATIGEWSKP